MDVADFKWLLMDSCGATATLALGRGGQVLATGRVAGRAFSAEWPGELRGLLAEAGWAVRELEVVAVVHGPGSFTGVRVGLAAAKGLCEATGARLVALSRLEVMVGLAAGAEAVAVVEGGRGEFYLRDGLNERVVGLEELLAAAQQRPVVTLGVELDSVLAGANVRRMEMEAGSALPLLLARVGEGRFDEVATIDANYVRGEMDIYGAKRGHSGE